MGGAQSSQCSLMRSKHGQKWHYLKERGTQYVLLPYRGAKGSSSDLAALIALPAEGRDANPIGDVNVATVCARMQQTTKEEGVIFLPRFKIGSESPAVDLTPALKAMGLSTIFTDFADFSGISHTPLKVSTVRHKVVISVDEEGTEAAAA